MMRLVPLKPLLGTSAKLPIPTPATDWLKVTIQSTLARLVGFPLARVMDCTVGVVLLMV